MNRLAEARSPYLRAHATNPVDWWPWCDQAFAEARRRDCPVFLSIGYAACHWCHVMEAESFSDPVIGRLLREGFVSIKVDREERPDVDALYMEALVSMTGEGGWPANLWLTPDGRPFHAGTYFPPYYRYGTPAFGDVLGRVRQSWETGRRSVESLADRTRAALVEAHGSPTPGGVPPQTAVAVGVRRIVDAYDLEHGGWGYGPRFPQPPRIDLLLQAAALGAGPEPLDRALHLLDVVDRSGLHDHVGGGFHRYTVDEGWEVPHFEKMLADNAQLARALLRAWSLTARPRLATVGCETLEYLLDRLAHPDGGFSSSEDADDADGEGAFYTWTPSQLRDALGAAGALAVAAAFGVTEHGNHVGGGSVLFRRGDPGLLSAYRSKLRAVRSRRPAPAVDDKRVMAWNALSVSAFALGARLLGERRYLDVARHTAEVCLAMTPPAGNCPRTLEPGSPPGVLDDAACLADAMLDLYEATADRRWLDEAARITRAMLDAFLDPASGALWHSVADPTLPLRRVSWGDGAEPSGAGVAALVLVRLATLGAPGIGSALVDRLFGAASVTLAAEPAMCPTLLRALQVHTGPPRTLVVTGPDPALLTVATTRWRPDLLVAPIDRADPGPYSLFAGKTRGEPAGWLCEGTACRLPTRDPAQLAGWLGGKLST